LLRSFRSAARDGNLDQLVGLLAADVVACGDGGGQATATPQPIYGRDPVASFILALFDGLERLSVTTEPVLVNGGPGVITPDAGGKVVSVLGLEIRDGEIQAVRGVINPDKLQHLGEVSDLARLRPPDR